MDEEKHDEEPAPPILQPTTEVPAEEDDPRKADVEPRKAERVGRRSAVNSVGDMIRNVLGRR